MLRQAATGRYSRGSQWKPGVVLSTAVPENKSGRRPLRSPFLCPGAGPGAGGRSWAGERYCFCIPSQILKLGGVLNSSNASGRTTKQARTKTWEPSDTQRGGAQPGLNPGCCTLALWLPRPSHSQLWPAPFAALGALADGGERSTQGSSCSVPGTSQALAHSLSQPPNYPMRQARGWPRFIDEETNLS